MANTVAQNAGRSMSEMVELQFKVAKQFSLNTNNFGIQWNTQTIQAASGKAPRVRRLSVNLVNTELINLPESEKWVKSRQIATYTKANYAAASDIDEFCIALIQRNQLLFINMNRVEHQCFQSTEL